MKTIGIRELHQRTSEYIRLAKQGETVLVTERGEPVAHIVPIKKDEGILDRLIREGLASAPKGNLAEFLRDHPPLKPTPGVPLASELLQRERDSYER